MSCAAPLPARVPPAAADAPHPRERSPTPTAEALARLAAGGDARAFATLVERYHARCVRFARNMGLPPEDAEATRDLVARALAALPPEQREAFLLRHVEELAYEDIALATGARASALRMRVKRACDAIRAHLRREELP